MALQLIDFWSKPANWLEHCATITNLQVMGLNPTRSCVCGVDSQGVALRPSVSGVTSAEAKNQLNQHGLLIPMLENTSSMFWIAFGGILAEFINDIKTRSTIITKIPFN